MQIVIRKALSSRRMLFTMLLGGLALGPGLGIVWAQPRLQFGRPANFSTNGFHLYNIGGSFGYISQAANIGAGVNTNAGDDYQAWASTTLGYSYLNPLGSSVNITYTPSYTGRVRFSNLQAFNQNLVVGFNRRIGSHWNAFLTLNGGDNVLENFIFNVSALGQTIGTPIELSSSLSGALAGLTVNNNVAVFGTRQRTAGTSLGLTYAPSTRFTFNTSLNGSFTSSKQDQLVQFSSVVPRLWQGNAQASVSYGLSPRTRVGVSANHYRMWSKLRSDFASLRAGNYNYTNLAAFAERQLGVRWFVGASFGPSFYNNIRASVVSGSTDTTRDITIGYFAAGNIGYRLKQHSFALNYSRTLGDQVGLAAGSTTTMTGAWNYFVPSSGWNFQAGGGRIQYGAGAVGGKITNPTAYGAIGKLINRQLSARLEYGYVAYSTPGAPAFDAHSARISLTYTPLIKDIALPEFVGADPKNPRQQDGTAVPTR